MIFSQICFPIYHCNLSVTRGQECVGVWGMRGKDEYQKMLYNHSNIDHVHPLVARIKITTRDWLKPVAFEKNGEEHFDYRKKAGENEKKLFR